ncbi:Ethanolamine ammonia-lyase light chain [Rhodoferax ferrireducens T118]|uniref:Ethanolamine ammonia-lyase small subunit n=1 Tax=Albidiferax ferrireducens (strain ATCC BAA-621 / DSM 15236 / T118) TaxID=338969 RepID=Q221G5_ALBFT|nr:ethanolamine ammonia-lyase subunit EutC [Rhodoferax ferrireducens]ABD68338.1 Ethanolamine ammonia-lyase light chain [Rhodoferax ferrireducens T118]
MDDPTSPVIANPWAALRQFTDARIALGRAGVSLPTAAHLDFQLAHAKARDAVHLALDAPQLAQSLNAARGDQQAPCLLLHSAAADRPTYLQRPDLGRRLDAASSAAVDALEPAQAPSPRPYDLAFVVVDGLSALAIEQNAAPFLRILQARIAPEHWSVAPICIVKQGRVAIGDEVAERLGAKAVVVLIGERPGLSAADSMGLYLTWMPRVGLLDASRNCISNVRPAGLGFDEAAYKLHYLLSQARQRQLSGVELKDETGGGPDRVTANQTNFLLDHAHTPNEAAPPS